MNELNSYIYLYEKEENPLGSVFFGRVAVNFLLKMAGGTCKEDSI